MTDRLSLADLMQSAVGGDVAARQVGAVLVLGTGPHGVPDVRRVLAQRAAESAALRRRLLRPSPLLRRPYWADDPDFDVRAHLGEMSCPAPGNERALLDLAAAKVVASLPGDRPPWSVTVVTGLADGTTGLIVVMDHVLADGVVGLRLLGMLTDHPAVPQPGSGPASGTAGTLDLAGTPDPAGAGGVSARQPGRRRGVGLVRAAVTELGGIRLPRRMPRTSLNRPIGGQRRIDLVDADLTAVRTFAHAHGGTVNDVVLAAVAGALRELLAGRREELPEVCFSVPVSARRGSGDKRLGNQVGVMPVHVRTGGGLGERVRLTAAATRERKTRLRGASAAFLVPGFLLLARIGLLAWFVNHQRLINTFVTNLHGPLQQLTIAGVPVESITAIPVTTGNVTVTFGVLSYAGTLRVTVVSDPGRVPDAAALTAALRGELSVIPAPCQGGRYARPGRA